jgi:hypothetical protein
MGGVQFYQSEFFIGLRVSSFQLMEVCVTVEAAMNSLCRTFAKEEHEISSFAVRPGVVDVSPSAASRAFILKNP